MSIIFLSFVLEALNVTDVDNSYGFMTNNFLQSKNTATFSAILSSNGSVTLISSPSSTRLESALSRLRRVACSSVGGFCIYNVIPLALTTLGADKRKFPPISFSWMNSLRDNVRETFILWTVDVQTRQSSFRS